MIELLQFPPGGGLMNFSPFCMKVEVFLRLGGLPYRCENTTPLRSPKGKLPVLREDGRLVADSSAILAYLQQRHAPRLPPSLRDPDQGERLALRRMFEEHLYFIMLWSRWMTNAGYAVSKPAFFGTLPPGPRDVLAAFVRRKTRRDLAGQGIGRHSAEEISERGCADIDAAARMLRGAPYFGGSEPAVIDATLYAFLANILWVPLDTRVRQRVAQDAALAAYCERMRERVGQ